MVAFQSMSCSGVELGQSEKSGKVEGRSKTVLVSGAPSPCALRAPGASGLVDRLARRESTRCRSERRTGLRRRGGHGDERYQVDRNRAKQTPKGMTHARLKTQSVSPLPSANPAATRLFLRFRDGFAGAFNDLLGRLGTATRTQRQFMADASHELRTPVSVIQTATEVTLGQPTRPEAEYREALTIIGEQTARLGELVQDMFMLARADADGYRVPMRRLYVDEVVAEAVRAAAVVAAAKGVDVTFDIQPEVAIDGDDDLLHRMATNLLDNAVQHTPPGGSIKVVLTADARTATITVADTGPGIPDPDRHRIFERFVRLDPARSASSGGGLGLPIARWIAEQHHGTLALDPSPRGCVFVVQVGSFIGTQRTGGAAEYRGVGRPRR